MLEELFFVLGLLNNLLLIAIFVLRGTGRLDIVRRIGYVYLLLALPGVYALVVALRQQGAVRYAIFVGIFLAFLALEGVYDFWLDIPFRQNWKLLAPYLILYYAMNYGFVVMVWKTSPGLGILMLVLFVVQIAVNALTHRRRGAQAG